jgi:serine/threonine protein kinase
LNSHLYRYKGRALEALLAFKPLVEGIVHIHEKRAIHRDIKTENIFVASDGRLVLGDFGIVFFADEQRTRLTDVLGERVGSHFWMAPWAYEPVRLSIDEIKPALDIFPLGKVLWSMVAGRDGPVYWEYNRPGNDLETMFPEDPSMRHINEVLSHCIVREESDCVKTAEGLIVFVDETINEIAHLDRRTRDRGEWLCLVCKKGYYGKEKLGWRSRDFVTETNNNAQIGDLTAYFCDYCGHVQFFKPKWDPS